MGGGPSLSGEVKGDGPPARYWASVGTFGGGGALLSKLHRYGPPNTAPVRGRRRRYQAIWAGRRPGCDVQTRGMTGIRSRVLRRSLLCWFPVSETEDAQEERRRTRSKDHVVSRRKMPCVVGGRRLVGRAWEVERGKRIGCRSLNPLLTGEESEGSSGPCLAQQALGGPDNM